MKALPISKPVTAGIIIATAAVAASGSKPATALPEYLNDSICIERRIDDALSRMTLDEKIAMIHAQSKFSTPGCPRLGIPEIWMSDGPHGVRMEFSWDDWLHAGWTNDSCTALPALTCLAATFNPDLAHAYGEVIGAEARFRGKDIMLGPGVNLYRTPLSGRNFEYMGEDPLLASRMVVPYIRGVQSFGVAACLKHFILNNQEHNRNDINVVVDRRALNELYLPAFKAGVTEGGVWAVMGSYNKYGNTYCTHNDTLVNSILKGRWGFDGVMITDWGSAHDTRQAALNGLDIEMGSWTNGLTWGRSNAYDYYYMAEPLKKLVRAGEIPESIVNDKVRRVLRLCMRTNMDRTRPWGRMHTPEHLETARRVAREGIVLLRNNDSFLPLRPGTRIAVIGENAIKKLSIGGGSSELKPRVEISPLQALEARFGKENVSYTLGYASGEPDYSRELQSPYDADSLHSAAISAARTAEVVLFIGGLNKNYRQDCEGEDRENYSLPFGQDKLIADIAAVNPNTAVVLVSGNAVAMPWANDVQAIIQSWYAGSVGFEALAEIIAGDCSPSGKMPFSIPYRLEDCAAHSNVPRTYPGVDNNVYYDESILMGYRWHLTRGIDARFPFGHGLSYTTFSYSAPSTDRTSYCPTDTITLNMTLSNTGSRTGAETVQIYASQHHPRLMRPARELKGFAKATLQPGESRRIEIAIPVSSLAYYNDSTDSWVLDNDIFTLHIASSSTDLRGSATIRITQPTE